MQPVADAFNQRLPRAACALDEAKGGRISRTASDWQALKWSESG
jgi:hypothetical protein